MGAVSARSTVRLSGASVPTNSVRRSRTRTTTRSNLRPSLDVVEPPAPATASATCLCVLSVPALFTTSEESADSAKVQAARSGQPRCVTPRSDAGHGFDRAGIRQRRAHSRRETCSSFVTFGKVAPGLTLGVQWREPKGKRTQRRRRGADIAGWRDPGRDRSAEVDYSGRKVGCANLVSR